MHMCNINYVCHHGLLEIYMSLYILYITNTHTHTHTSNAM